MESWRLALGIEHGNRDVEDEEEDQEELRRQVVVRHIARHAPARTDQEGERKAEQIEQPPGALERNRQDASVEQRVVGEQADVAALPGRGQDGRGKAADDAEDG